MKKITFLNWQMVHRLSMNCQYRQYYHTDTPGKKNKKVNAGDLLARIPLDFQKSKDITGGLPRVAELFERKPKDYSFISDIRGRVEFGSDVRANKKLIVVDIDNKDNQVEYLVPKGKHIMVQEGDIVNKGDLLMEETLFHMIF